MKKLLTISILAILSACGGKESDSTEQKNVLENLTYSVDTLVVDPGEDIINLSHGAMYSSVSLDKQKYFHYDYKKTAINEIDLQKLKLTETYTFSKEGPNSIGFNPPTIQPLSDDRFLFVSSGINVGTYSKNGEKERSLKYNFREIEGLEKDEEGLITHQVQISQDEKLLFSLTRPNPTRKDVRLIIIDPETKTGKSISLPNMVSTLRFKIDMLQGDSYLGVKEAIFLKILNEKLFITSSANSDTYVYDYQKDSLSLYEFPHQLVASRKSAEVKNKVEDENEFFAEWAKFKYQVGFEKFLWDDQGQKYFRIGRRAILNDNKELEDHFDIFLFAYDSNLNLLGETQLVGLKNPPEKPFFKDGKLYSYVNVEDELGFAVFTFDF